MGRHLGAGAAEDAVGGVGPFVTAFVTGTAQRTAKRGHRGPQIGERESWPDLLEPDRTTERHTKQGSLGVKRSGVQISPARRTEYTGQSGFLVTEIPAL
jgi:hypothetical protein